MADTSSDAPIGLSVQQVYCLLLIARSLKELSTVSVGLEAGDDIRVTRKVSEGILSIENIQVKNKLDKGKMKEDGITWAVWNQIQSFHKTCFVSGDTNRKFTLALANLSEEATSELDKQRLVRDTIAKIELKYNVRNKRTLKHFETHSEDFESNKNYERKVKNLIQKQKNLQKDKNLSLGEKTKSSQELEELYRSLFDAFLFVNSDSSSKRDIAQKVIPDIHVDHFISAFDVIAPGDWNSFQDQTITHVEEYLKKIGQHTAFRTQLVAVALWAEVTRVLADSKYSPPLKIALLKLKVSNKSFTMSNVRDGITALLESSKGQTSSEALEDMLATMRLSMSSPQMRFISKVERETKRIKESSKTDAEKFNELGTLCTGWHWEFSKSEEKE